ncbi:MAG: hypothetical protein HY657_20405 [Acidobacteria bacterium]|nr:hypothetical protein [Acidobacteriota bacterium]
MGDVVKSVNGVPATNWKGLQDLQRRPAAGESWPLVVERDGEMAQLQISPARLRPSDVILARGRSFLGLCFLGFTLWAWFASPGTTTTLLAVFGQSFGFLLMGTPYFASRALRDAVGSVVVVTFVVGIVALVHFLLAFPSRRAFLDRRWATVILYGPGAIVALITIGDLVHPIELKSGRGNLVIGMLYNVFMAVYFLWAIVLLVWRYVATQPSERAMHGLGIMLASTVLAFGPFLVYPIVTSLWPASMKAYQLYSPYSSFTFALIPIAFSVAAVRSARSKRAAERVAV